MGLLCFAFSSEKMKGCLLMEAKPELEKKLTLSAEEALFTAGVAQGTWVMTRIVCKNTGFCAILWDRMS